MNPNIVYDENTVYELDPDCLASKKRWVEGNEDGVPWLTGKSKSSSVEKRRLKCCIPWIIAGWLLCKNNIQ